MLPDAWISKIFAKLEGRYGSLFIDRWRGCDMANVRETWAEELGPFRDKPDCIAYALKSLAAQQFPPTLPEFLAACRRAPEKEVPALPYKPTAEDHERARIAAEKAAQVVKKISDGIDKHWATHPRSHLQLKAIFEAAANDSRFRPCIEQMVKNGICSADGHLLKQYRDGQWFQVHRCAA